jgi:hypothetical protein
MPKDCKTVINAKAYFNESKFNLTLKNFVHSCSHFYLFLFPYFYTYFIIFVSTLTSTQTKSKKNYEAYSVTAPLNFKGS